MTAEAATEPGEDRRRADALGRDRGAERSGRKVRPKGPPEVQAAGQADGQAASRARRISSSVKAISSTR